MPNYVYRSKDPACAGFEAHEPMTAPSTRCPDCGAAVYRAITNRGGTVIRYTMRGDMRDYRVDLARFPGDRTAFVDGPRALSRLKDARKRAGWQLGKLEDVGDASSIRPGRDGRELFDEALAEAKRDE